EIGPGTGNNAALLAHHVGPGRETSNDVDRDVLSRARDSLRRFSNRQVRIEHADGRAGFPAGAPYDRIIVTASAAEIEPAWLEQLSPAGKLLVPLVLAPGLEFIAVGSVTAGRFDGQLTRAAYFMPLRGERDVGPLPAEATLPPPQQMKPLAAPWLRWFEQGRRRAGWAAFSQSLALYMLLQGGVIHHCTLDDGSFLYGVSRNHSGRGAWFGKEAWFVSDEAVGKIVYGLFRSFLEASAPCPIDYDLVLGEELSAEMSENTFVRRGPRWQQQWRLQRRPRSNWL
ncbi:MAG: protein-L-isoaspartate O-methyltransferase, partial [Gemmataceae bacterium]